MTLSKTNFQFILKNHVYIGNQKKKSINSCDGNIYFKSLQENMLQNNIFNDLNDTITSFDISSDYMGLFSRGYVVDP